MNNTPLTFDELTALSVGTKICRIGSPHHGRIYEKLGVVQSFNNQRAIALKVIDPNYKPAQNGRPLFWHESDITSGRKQAVLYEPAASIPQAVNKIRFKDLKTGMVIKDQIMNYECQVRGVDHTYGVVSLHNCSDPNHTSRFAIIKDVFDNYSNYILVRDVKTTNQPSQVPAKVLFEDLKVGMVLKEDLVLNSSFEIEAIGAYVTLRDIKANFLSMLHLKAHAFDNDYFFTLGNKIFTSSGTWTKPQSSPPPDSIGGWGGSGREILQSRGRSQRPTTACTNKTFTKENFGFFANTWHEYCTVCGKKKDEHV